jgi:small neutral amino acid transporter SnatA (MarC family)
MAATQAAVAWYLIDPLGFTYVFVSMLEPLQTGRPNRLLAARLKSANQVMLFVAS